VVLTLGLLALFLPLMPRPAAALSCIHPKDALPGYALLVKAKVLKLERETPPRAGISGVITIGASEAYKVTLAVERYFKGQGPAELHVRYDGMGWAQMAPVGSEIIVGFHLDEEKHYAAGPCSLMMNAKPGNEFEAEMLTIILEQYGEGKAPSAEAPVPVPPGLPSPPAPEGKQGWWILWTAMGALALGVASVVILRRKAHN
jgi:hypothetical protein